MSKVYFTFDFFHHSKFFVSFFLLAFFHSFECFLYLHLYFLNICFFLIVTKVLFLCLLLEHKNPCAFVYSEMLLRIIFMICCRVFFCLSSSLFCFPLRAETPADQRCASSSAPSLGRRWRTLALGALALTLDVLL